MATHLLSLYPEVLDIIWDYCNVNDLRNLSLCSKECYKKVNQEKMWHAVKFKWHCLANQSLVPKRIKNLRFTRKLYFVYERDSCSEAMAEAISTSLDYVYENINRANISSVAFKGLHPSESFQHRENNLVSLDRNIFSFLRSCRNLKHVRFHKTCFCNVSWLAADCKNIEKLEIIECINLPYNLEPLQDFPKLKKITLHETYKEQKFICGLKVISSLVNLVELNLLGAYWRSIHSDHFSRIVKTLIRLQVLSVRGCSVNDETFYDMAANLKALRELHVYGMDRENVMTTQTFHHISQMSSLKLLNLEGRCIGTGAKLQLPLSLETLNLCHCQVVGDEQLASLVVLEHLIELNISRCGVTDAGLLELAKFKSLQKLNAVNCRGITDNGLKCLPVGVRLVEMDNCHLSRR